MITDTDAFLSDVFKTVEILMEASRLEEAELACRDVCVICAYAADKPDPRAQRRPIAEGQYRWHHDIPGSSWMCCAAGPIRERRHMQTLAVVTIPVSILSTPQGELEP